SRLRACGLQVESQVRYSGALERVDLVVEGAVAVEVDGDEHHRETFELDRARDLAITRAGLHALRPSARQVFGAWPAVQAAVERALRERGILVRLDNSGVAALRQPATRRRSTHSPATTGHARGGAPPGS
ncbi:MAG: hypothetical protein ACLGH5_04610, partial [Actinomycetes bacterium]